MKPVVVDGVGYKITVPSSMSDVDLELRDSFQVANGRQPSEAEVLRIWDAIADSLREDIV